MTLSALALGEKLVEAIEAAGCPTRPLSALGDRPLLLLVDLPTGPRRFKVFLWRISPGGKNRPDDERRVQTTHPTGTTFTAQEEEAVLLLGYDEQLDCFCAWDARMHEDAGKSSSLQTRLGHLEEAKSSGFATFTRGVLAGVEQVVAFTPNQVTTYLGLVSHSSGTAGQAAMAAVADELVQVVEEPLGKPREEIEQERERVPREIVAIARDRKFAGDVMAAYGQECAVCGLGGKILDAAHIRAVGLNGPDTVDNGIALCPLHHRLYDRHIIEIDLELNVVLDRDVGRRLELSDEDLDRIAAEIRPNIADTFEPGMGPNPDFLQSHKSPGE